MSKVYGYCRVSTQAQKLERQIANIQAINAEAIIISEKITGTTLNRAEWQKLNKKLKSGDTVIFDEISRMSRTAADGFKAYEDLYKRGVNLIFVKQRYLDTENYRAALAANVPMSGTDIDCILEGVNKYLMILAENQIKAAFEQAQGEVDLLHKRISEGIARAAIDGKRIGTQKGDTLTTKKSIEAKEKILKYNKDFNGTLNDDETRQLCGVARNSYYKYKRELKQNITEA